MGLMHGCRPSRVVAAACLGPLASLALLPASVAPARAARVSISTSLAAVAANSELSGVRMPAHLGAPGGLHQRRLCPHGPCQIIELVRADGSADVADSSEPFWLTPPELHLVYQLPTDSVTSTPPTIAVIESGDDPTAEHDLNEFSKKFGLPSCTSTSTPQCLYEYNGSGIPYTPGSSPSSYKQGNAADYDSALETTLDLEAVHATCEDCRLMLVQTNLGGDTTQNQGLDDMAAAVAWAGSHGGPGGSGAVVLSNSYAYGGSSFTLPSTSEAAYTDYDQPGHVIVASSGDTGYHVFYPAYPAVNPNVVAVGGTTLSANPDGTYAGETVWNDGVVDGYLSATGSSCDEGTYLAPPWQEKDPQFELEGCEATIKGKEVDYRTSADVSADADPDTGFEVYQSFEPDSSELQIVGGTSLSAPIIAGVYGLAGGYPSRAPSGGCPSGTSCAAYAPYADQGYAVPALHDITTGYNVATESECPRWTICKAAPGLDGPTGVGTPIGTGAFGGPSRPNALTGEASEVTPYSATMSATVDPQGQSGTTADICFGLSDPYAYCTAAEPVSGGVQMISQSTATVTGLVPDTTYHYRAFASGPGGLGIGADATFTTAAVPPPAPPPSPPASQSQTAAGAGTSATSKPGGLGAPIGEISPVSDVQLVSCMQVTKGSGARHTMSERCKQLGPVRPSTSARARIAAVLLRGKVVYATGSASESGRLTTLLLTPRHAIGKGRYTLMLTHGRKRVRETITIV